MEARKDGHEDAERQHLKRQAADENVDADALRRTLPILRAGNPRPGGLHEEGDDVAQDEDAGQKPARDAEDSVAVGWQHGSDQSPDQEVVAGSDEDRGEDDEAQRDDERALKSWLIDLSARIDDRREALVDGGRTMPNDAERLKRRCLLTDRASYKRDMRLTISVCA